MPAQALPSFYGWFELGIFLFFIIILSIYRTRLFSAIKEFLYDLLFAIVFTGATMAIFLVRDTDFITLLFFGSLIIIFASRIIYSLYFNPTGSGAAPLQSSPSE